MGRKPLFETTDKKKRKAWDELTGGRSQEAGDREADECEEPALVERPLTREEKMDADSCLMEFLNAPDTVFVYKKNLKTGVQTVTARKARKYEKRSL